MPVVICALSPPPLNACQAAGTVLRPRKTTPNLGRGEFVADAYIQVELFFMVDSLLYFFFILKCKLHFYISLEKNRSVNIYFVK